MNVALRKPAYGGGHCGLCCWRGALQRSVQKRLELNEMILRSLGACLKVAGLTAGGTLLKPCKAPGACPRVARGLQGEHKWLGFPMECWCWCLAAALASAGCCTACVFQGKGKRNNGLVKAPLSETASLAPIRLWWTGIDSSAATLICPETACAAESFSSLILCKCSPFSALRCCPTFTSFPFE